MIDSTLYLITDRKCVHEGTMLFKIEEAFKGGLNIIQLRDKDSPTGELVHIGSELRKLCDRYDATFLVNRNLQVYQQCKADGLHLGFSDIDRIKTLKENYPGIIIGVSTHSVKEALLAETHGASYVTLGPVYETPSKKGMGEPLGPEEVGKGAAKLNIPVFGLGGVGISNAKELKSFGINHLAMIRSVLTAENPAKAVKDLLQIME